jgi:hypothetical protein
MLRLVTSNYRTKRLTASKYSYFANGRFSDEAKKGLQMNMS